MSDGEQGTDAVDTVKMTAEQLREAAVPSGEDGQELQAETETAGMSVDEIRKATEKGSAVAAAEPAGLGAPSEQEANDPGANTARADAFNRQGEADPDQIRVKRYAADHVPSPIEPITLSGPRGGGNLVVLDAKKEPDPLTLPDGVYGQLDLALAAGDIRGAINTAPALQSDTELSDNDARTRSVLARAHLMEGDLASAAKVLGSFRDDIRLVLADASMCIAEGNIQRGQMRVTAALDENPTGVAEHYVAALLRVAQGRLDEASSLLAQVSRSLPEHAVARHQLGQLVQATGDPARAGTLYEMASEIAPMFLPPALALAEMLADSRQYGEAMSIIAALGERMPEMLAPRLLRLRILLEVGEAPTALSLADVLRKGAPGNMEVQLYWAEAAFRTGRTDDARSSLLEVAEKADGENQAKAYRLLGKIEQELGKTSVAAGHLKNAVAANPASGELVLELCQYLLADADPQGAIELLESYSERNDADVGTLLSGAVLSQNHGLGRIVRVLGESALSRVIGTPSEGQVRAVLGSIGGPSI